MERGGMRQASETWTSDPRLPPLFPPCCVQALWLHVPAAQREQGTKNLSFPWQPTAKGLGRGNAWAQTKNQKQKEERYALPSPCRHRCKVKLEGREQGNCMGVWWKLLLSTRGRTWDSLQDRIMCRSCLLPHESQL